MKSRDGKSQRRSEKRREEKKKEYQKREILGRKKIQADAEPSGQMRDEKLHAILAQSTYISQSQCTKHHARTAFGC